MVGNRPLIQGNPACVTVAQQCCWHRWARGPARVHRTQVTCWSLAGRSIFPLWSPEARHPVGSCFLHTGEHPEGDAPLLVRRAGVTEGHPNVAATRPAGLSGRAQQHRRAREPVLRRLSHHVARSRKGRRSARAAQASAASSVRQGQSEGGRGHLTGLYSHKCPLEQPDARGQRGGQPAPGVVSEHMPTALHPKPPSQPHRKHAGTKHTNTEMDSKWE